jgi:hypothetical protein
MALRFTVPGVVPIVAFSLLLLAIVLPWIIAPVVPPSPELLISINDEIFSTARQPLEVKVKQGELIQVRVQAYYQGRLINPGEFNYRWCFDPPINDNPHCTDEDFKAEANSDYKPENLDEQGLEITVKHDALKTTTVSIVFKPE